MAINVPRGPQERTRRLRLEVRAPVARSLEGNRVETTTVQVAPNRRAYVVVLREPDKFFSSAELHEVAKDLAKIIEPSTAILLALPRGSEIEVYEVEG